MILRKSDEGMALSASVVATAMMVGTVSKVTSFEVKLVINLVCFSKKIMISFLTP